MVEPLTKIGVSACFFHHDPQRLIFKGKRLMYVEEQMSQYLLDEGVFPVMIPTEHTLSLKQMLNEVDGLLLQGGSDVCPESYGEKPLKPEWSGDKYRDDYESALVHECLATQKPILGICRGLQILNVALGGSLYQDIETQVENSLVHRDWHKYDDLYHEVQLNPGSFLSKLYGVERATINSIHHQAIKELGDNLLVEAVSPEDNIIEAVRLDDDSNFVLGVQWHPEFKRDKKGDLLDYRPIMKEFVNRVRQQKKEKVS